MDSFLLLRRLVAAIVFKGQTVSDYWWSRRTIFLTMASDATTEKIRGKNKSRFNSRHAVRLNPVGYEQRSGGKSRQQNKKLGKSKHETAGLPFVLVFKHTGEKKSAYGDQWTSVSHPRVSTAEVGNSAFRPNFAC